MSQLPMSPTVREALELLNRAVLETGTVVHIPTGEVYEFPALLDSLIAAVRAEEREKFAPLVAAVREWQEAASQYHDNPSAATRSRYDSAGADLAAIILDDTKHNEQEK